MFKFAIVLTSWRFNYFLKINLFLALNQSIKYLRDHWLILVIPGCWSCAGKLVCAMLYLISCILNWIFVSSIGFCILGFDIYTFSRRIVTMYPCIHVYWYSWILMKDLDIWDLSGFIFVCLKNSKKNSYTLYYVCIKEKGLK